MGASSNKEMDAVDLEEEVRRPGYQRRESGEVLRTDRERDPDPDPFDDVTPTRSLAEVGLADMDEDLPTRMQGLDELARLREAGAGQTSESKPAVRPYAKVAFKSFPAPAEKPANEAPVDSAATSDAAIDVPIDIDEPADTNVAEPSIVHPSSVASETNAVAPRSQRVFVAISIALLLAAVAVLASDHFVR